jgi:hypothetical protein
MLPPKVLYRTGFAMYFVLLALCCMACASAMRVLPVRQRVVILKHNMPLFALRHGERTNEALHFSALYDTLLSTATAFAPDESGEHRLFFVRLHSEEAWLDSHLGQHAETEYHLSMRVCDTDFTLPSSMDSIAWARASSYVADHATEAIERLTPTLIQTGKHYRTPSTLGFTIRRKAERDGTRYTVRSNGDDTAANAHKCAFFIQTGKTERDFRLPSLQHSE